jgi:hypothetical protein
MPRFLKLLMSCFILTKPRTQRLNCHSKGTILEAIIEVSRRKSEDVNFTRNRLIMMFQWIFECLKETDHDFLDRIRKQGILIQDKRDEPFRDTDPAREFRGREVDRIVSSAVTSELQKSVSDALRVSNTAKREEPPSEKAFGVPALVREAPPITPFKSIPPFKSIKIGGLKPSGSSTPSFGRNASSISLSALPSRFPALRVGARSNHIRGRPRLRLAIPEGTQSVRRTR